MHVESIFTSLAASVTTQVAVAGGDPTVEEAAGHLMAALRPAVQAAVFEMAQQAAAEVQAQLEGRSVDVVLQDGDPTLRISDPSAAPVGAEDFDARLTLRLPPSVKGLVEEAAGVTGESVNSWVVNALSRAGRSRSAANRVKGSFDL